MRTSFLCVLTLLSGLSACSKPAEPPAPASQPPAVPPATQPANPIAEPVPAPQASAATPTADAPGTAPASAAPATAAPAHGGTSLRGRDACARNAGPCPGRERRTRAACDTATASSTEWKEVTLPAGTQLGLPLHTAVASDTSKVEDPGAGDAAP